ncbi:hypothetical protein E4U30_000195, partial [Claviceps sp. LM220 group G6]
MVWFLEPAIFFESKKMHVKRDKKDEKSMSSTSNMKKRLEHYEISYWTLIALNWIQLKTTIFHASRAPIMKDKE